MRPRNTRFALAIILALALSLRVYGIDFGLPLHLHPDEWSQVETARQMLNGDLNPHFFRYSSLFIDQLYVVDSALEIVTSLSGIAFSSSTFYLLGRLLSVFYGTLTVWAIFLLGRAVVNAQAGLIVALLMAIAPEHVRESHYATVDVAMVFWAVLAIALAVRSTKDRPGLFRASAVCAGLALGTKYSAAFILPPLVGFLIWRVVREKETSWKWIHPRVLSGSLAFLGLCIISALLALPTPAILEQLRQWTTLGTIHIEYLRLFDLVRVLGWIVGFAILAMGVGGLWNSQVQGALMSLFSPQLLLFLSLVLVVFLLTSPFILLDLPNAARDILYEYRHALIGATAQLDPTDPLFATSVPSDFSSQSAFYLTAWLNQNGLLMTVGVFAGVILLARGNIPVLFLIGTIVVLLFVGLSRSANTSERYALLGMPFLIFCAGMGLTAVAARSQIYMILGLIATLFVPVTSSAAVLYREFFLPDTRVLASRWLTDNATPNVTIVRESNTPDIENASQQFRVKAVTSAFEKKSFVDWQSEGVRYFMIGTVSSWYRANASAYPDIARNYDLLDSRAYLIQSFAADESSSGPPIWIYQLP